MSVEQFVGWALIHSLWEDAAVLAALLISRIAVRSAGARYVCACLAMVACLVLPLGTALNKASQVSPAAGAGTHYSAPVLPSASGTDLSGAAVPVEPAVPTVPTTTEPTIEVAFPVLVPLWLLGAALMTLRLLGGFLALRRLTASGSEPDPAWTRLTRSLGERLGIGRPVSLYASAHVNVPTAIGALRGIVLFPTSALTRLDPSHIEALIAHELAHIRRFDYLANLLQSVIETLLFYHPAVWWISGLVRTEREHCCDDIAVRLLGNRTAYARALADMEGLRSTWPGLAPAADGSSLRTRILRLLGLTPRPRTAASLWTVAGLSALVVAVLCHSAFAHIPDPKERVPVTGIVLDVDGRPAAGATVYCRLYSRQAHDFRDERLTSDSDGEFRFERGPSDLVAAAAIRNGNEMGFSQWAPLSPGTSIHLEPVKDVSVQMVDESGNPKAGIRASAVTSGERMMATWGPLPRELASFLGSTSDTFGRAEFKTSDDPAKLRPGSFVLSDDRFVVKSITRDATTRLVLEPGCEILGRLTAGGVPLSHVMVSGTRVDPKAGSRTVATYSDDSGAFRLAGLPPGKTYLDTASTNEWAGRLVAIDAKPGPQHVHLALTRGAEVEVRVLDPNGRPKTNQFVMIGRQDDVPIVPVLKRTDSRGEIEARVAPGDYRARLLYSQPSKRFSVRDGERDLIELRSDTPDDSNLIATKFGVRDASGRPVAGAHVEYMYKGEKWPYEGRLETNDLAKGEIRLTAEQAKTLRFVAWKGEESSDSVAPKDGFALIRLKTIPPTTIEGRVLMPDGSPFQNAKISLQGSLGWPTPDAGARIYRTGALGAYRITACIPSWCYSTVNVSAPGYEDRRVDLGQVKPGSRVEATTVRFEPRSPGRFKVLGPDGQPVPNAKVGYSWIDATNVVFTATARANAAGDGIVEVPAREVRNLWFRSNHDKWFSDLKVRPLNGLAVIRLRPVAPVVVRGAVLDESGRPMSGVEVTAAVMHNGTTVNWPELLPWQRTKTDANGRYQVLDLYPAMDVWISVDAAGYETGTGFAKWPGPGKVAEMPVLHLGKKAGQR